MNQEMKNAISDVIDYHSREEEKDFLGNVEYETKAEWIEELKGHLVYQYMVLAEYGECVSVAEEAERLWVELGREEPEEADKELWTVNEQELTNAVEAVCDRQAGDEQRHFLENVEFKSKEEWIEELEGHIVYQYMVLSKYGNMEAVAEEIENLWVDFGQQDLLDEAEEKEEA